MSFPPGPSPSLSASYSAVLILQCALSALALRHVRSPPSKIIALIWILSLCRLCDDEARLQRAIAYLCSLMDDPDPQVRSAAVRASAALLSSVRTFPPWDALFFPRYVFRKVSFLSANPDLSVLAAFSACAAELACDSRRFLDAMHARF